MPDQAFEADRSRATAAAHGDAGAHRDTVAYRDARPTHRDADSSHADADARRRAAEAYDRADKAAKALGTGAEVFSGAEGLVRLATLPAADIVLIAIVGTAGLAPALSTAS